MSRSSHSTTPVTNWTTLTTTVSQLAPMSFIGRFHSARRCIDPPRIELSAVDGATTYDIVVSPLTASDTVLRATSTIAEVDLAEAWPHLPIGMLQITGRAFDRDGRLLGSRPSRSLRQGSGCCDCACCCGSAIDYHAAGAGVIDYLCHGLPIARVHPDDPAYMWHAAVRPVGNDTAPTCSFPALCYPRLIDLFLTGYRLKLGEDLLARSTRLADFLIDHPIVSDGPLAGVPMSTIGQDGNGRSLSSQIASRWSGSAGPGPPCWPRRRRPANQRYADYAARLGEDPARHPAGRRLLAVPGAPLATARCSSRTRRRGPCAAAPARTPRRTSDDPYAASIRSRVAWVRRRTRCRTGLWQQMYEDVPTLEPVREPGAVGGAGNGDAAAAARAIRTRLRSRGSWCATSRTSSSSSATRRSLPRPYLPFTPCGAGAIPLLLADGCPHRELRTRATLALHEATGDGDWARKAIAAANTVVRCRRPTVGSRRWCRDRRFGVRPRFTDWFNCMAHAADVLLTLDRADGAR